MSYTNSGLQVYRPTLGSTWRLLCSSVLASISWPLVRKQVISKKELRRSVRVKPHSDTYFGLVGALRQMFSGGCREPACPSAASRFLASALDAG